MFLTNHGHRRVSINWPRILAIGVNVALWALVARYLLWVAAGMRL